MRIFPLLVACALARPALAQTDSTWRDHNRAADAAIARRDWPQARHHALVVDSLLGGHPAVVMALASIAARAGDTAEALAQLRRVAGMGVVRSLADTAFNAIRASASFRAVAQAIAANASTIGHAEVMATIADSEAIAEDLSWEPSQSRFIVSDVRRRRLRSVGIDGSVHDIGPVMPVGWAVLGVAVDAPRGSVWATTVTLPQAEGYSRVDSGRAAILRIDLATGAVLRRFDLPSPSRAAPGDIALAENHDVFIGDGMTGAIYVVRAATDSLETLVPAGRFRATQQPAMSPDRRTFFIPDYGRGIARVDRATGAITWLGRASGVTLTGIDGLIVRGRELIAVQNGVTPNRIVRLLLNEGATSVVRSEILLRDSTLAAEPTHIVQAQGQLYLIGNAGWSKYEDDGTPKAGAARSSPRILSIALPR